MPAVTAAIRPPRPDIALDFRRTIDRSQVHRAAVSEVFLTDLVRTAPGLVHVGAQLPTSHAYFLDSTDHPAAYGISLIGECTRQACTYIAHRCFDVPAGWMFLMTEVAARLLDPAALRVGDRPAELVIEARPEAGLRGGRLRALTVTLDVWNGAAHVARMTGGGRYMTREEYAFLRTGTRTGPVPLSTALARTAPGVPVAPALVGRTDPRNVLLADARRTDGGVTARLAIGGGHPTIFDHPLDHFPGMALIEAAAQATLLAGALEEPGGGPVLVTGVSGAFGRFAELDAPVGITAERAAPDPADGPGTRTDVLLTQDGETVADLAVRTGPARGNGGAAS